MFSRFVLLSLGAALLLVGLALATADYDDNMADAIKKLQQLDRYYSQVARPRLTRSEGEVRAPPDEDFPGDVEERPIINRAVRLLQLQTINDYYQQHSRPRFGKRSFSHVAWDRENPLEVGDEPWSSLGFPRRR